LKCSIDSRLENAVENQIRIGIGATDRTSTRMLLSFSDRNTDHRSAINRRADNLVRSLEVRVEAAERINARIQRKANVVAVTQDGDRR